MTTHVNFETAKLLKEKGFEQKERPSYLLVPFQECTIIDVFDHPSGNLGYGDKIGYYLPNKTVNAPTIAEVVMWLYEKHGIWIDVSLSQFSKPKDLQWMYSIVFTQRCTYSHSPKSYNSPTEAYEAAILYTLNNLI